MAGMCLRPQAESTHRRTAARGVHRDERVQQERNVVIPDVEIAIVNLRDPGERVEILDHRRIGIVYDGAVFPEARAGDFLERLAVRVIDDLIVEFLADDEIDGKTGTKRL